ncbi:MAG: GMP synthase (glutamine-hydrolysing) [Parcubacteria group bacterium Gr01-1014_38]|nr:MAG: GMP synthase (glutamine-hydrolysing) [Parcubacteria group bacterium Gr01-1014_38]
MIVIVHFGAQYAQLIRRAVNELGVRAVVISPKDAQRERPPDVCGVILSGSPASVNDEALACVRTVLAWHLPVLGICFGHQALVAASGGTVAPQFSREYGKANLHLEPLPSPLFMDVPYRSAVWMSHGDTVVTLPPGPWRVVGKTDRGHYAAIAHEEERLFGVQFHPEVSHTECGNLILRNFVLSICRAVRDFSPANLAQEMIRSVRERVGDTTHIMVACSLGVDSTMTALLCTKALGEGRVHPVFIDNGLQRDEDLELAGRARAFLPNLRVVDAAERFLRALENVTDAEEKRQIIGRAFWATFQNLACDLQARVPLGVYAQGTLAPDVIESGAESGKAAVIKTHHNLVAPPADFPFSLFEPLRTLYKDQVRVLGRAVGVRGDQRAFGWMAHLRAVTTRDFMTADVARFPPEFLPDVADRIVNQIPEVVHVTSSVTRKPPATIELE